MADSKYPRKASRRILFFGIFCLILLILAGCAKETAEPEEIVIDDTAQMLLDKLGVPMKVPQNARITQWQAATDVNGESYPQVNFIYQDLAWSYGAQPADGETPNHFTGVKEKWTDSREFFMGDIPCKMEIGSRGGWTGWVENGICHNIFSEDCEMEDLKTILYAMLAVDHSELVAEIEHQEASVVKGSRSALFRGIWKYDDFDRYLYIWDNMTYDFCGADMKRDKVVRFWAMRDREPVLELLDVSGDCVLYLTAEEEGENIRLTDSTGATLSPSKAVMNGKYYCYLGHWSLDGTTDLWLTEIMDLWVSDSYALALKAGDTLKFDEIMMEDIVIETLEEKEEGWLVINGSMDLKHDKKAEAWKLTGHDFFWLSWLGNCKLDLSAKIIDTLDKGKHKDLRKCFEAHDPDAVMGYVQVKKGIASSVEIVEVLK